ncbi:MAG: hypothetical protein KME38_24390 [Spirirestis rafaelensis WJT71-NPBG6]|nr:hypothetical protein [Spirirestis rafaelensis WJT71-NPBG6]
MPNWNTLKASLLSSYIKFGQSLIEFGQPLIEFGQSLIEFGQSLIEFGQSLIEFGQSLIEFGQPLIEFGQSLIEFGQPLIEFGQSLIEFGQSLIRYLAKVPNTPPLNPLPLARGGETKRSFGGVGFKFCDLCKRSIEFGQSPKNLLKAIQDIRDK